MVRSTHHNPARYQNKYCKGKYENVTIGKFKRLPIFSLKSKYLLTRSIKKHTKFRPLMQAYLAHRSSLLYIYVHKLFHHFSLCYRIKHLSLKYLYHSTKHAWKIASTQIRRSREEEEEKKKRDRYEYHI